MKEINEILFRIKLEGKGIVNNDSNEQKWAFLGEDSKFTSHLKSNHKNVTYAKKNFYRNDNDELYYKIKISSDALRYNMFRKDLVSQSPSIQHHDALLYSYVASPLGMIRGYMFASNKETVKRGSPLTITDAEQISKNKTYLETHSRSGEKDIHENKEGSDTSFFKKESVGDIEYLALGSIDLGELQFISADSVYDRYSLNPDKYENFYEKYAKLNIPNYEGKLGYYSMITAKSDLGEYGLKLSNETVKFLVSDIFKRLLDINIKKAGSYAKIKSLQIKFPPKPVMGSNENEDGWINIDSISDIENLDYDIKEKYVIQDESAAKEMRIDIEKAYQEEQDKKKAKKKAKKKSNTKKSNTDE